MTGGRAHPSRLAVHLIEIAMLVLPAGHVRRRWEHELIAELYGLNPRQQISFALITLMSAWSLRRALSNTPRGVTVTLISRPRKPLGCILNLRHHYVRRSNPDGERYRRCTRCGKDKYEGPYVGGIGIASMGPSGG